MKVSLSELDHAFPAKAIMKNSLSELDHDFQLLL
jgi:hypothetical protein